MKLRLPQDQDALRLYADYDLWKHDEVERALDRMEEWDREENVEVGGVPGVEEWEF